MPYYIGDVIQEERKLIARTPEKFREGGIDVRIETVVEAVDERAGEVWLAGGERLPYDTLVLATGTTALTPGVPGEGLPGVFTLKTYADALRIKAWIQEVPCRRAIIVGAGFIGMEMAEALRGRGIETAVHHRGTLPVNRWDPALGRIVLETLTGHGVDFVTGSEVRALEAGERHRLRLLTERGSDEADLVLLAVGVRPEVALARAMGLPLGASGAIAVNFAQRAGRENVYAVGDCAESFHRVSRRWVNIPLGDIANKQGRIAGVNIAGGAGTFPGIVGAQSFRCFDLEVAATGLEEREAAAAGFVPVSVLIEGQAMAGSMPGNSPLALKLIADRSSGRLLGAQAVGRAGAVSRINTLSAALWAGLGVDDAGWLDLAYAPPFSGSWDPIHIAAQRLRRTL